MAESPIGQGSAASSSLEGMSERPHKPVRMSPWRLEAAESEEDALWRLHPERQMAIAHDTAVTLVREGDEASRREKLSRLLAFVQDDGLDTLAELWSQSDPGSLPRALWRLFQIGEQLRAHPEQMAALVQRGIDQLHTIDPYVVGAEVPVTAEGVSHIIDEILSGTFTGDLADALRRAASLARVVSSGLLHWPDSEADHDLAVSSLAWGDIADDLARCAERERNQPPR